MPHHDHDHGRRDPKDDTELTELLDLGGSVLTDFWTDVFTVVHAAVGTAPERIVDLGAGTGAGTFALAEQFAGARITAVDSSLTMLERLRSRVAERGLADRVDVMLGDLDEGWPDVDVVDLVWASNSLHHVADPDRTLRDALAATRPGGLIVVAEIADSSRVLPDDVGRGVEGRLLDFVDAQHRHELPDLGADWPSRVSAAGWTVVGEHTIGYDVGAPYPDGLARFARLWLQRLRRAADDSLDADDRDALAQLLDEDGPMSVDRRPDLVLRGTRTVTVGRRTA